MRNLAESQKALRELLGQRVLVLDGAMGTMLQQKNLTAADFGGPALEGCNEVLVRTRPDVVLDIHRKYFRSEEHTSELQSHSDVVCRLLLDKNNDTPPYRRRVPMGDPAVYDHAA